MPDTELIPKLTGLENILIQFDIAGFSDWSREYPASKLSEMLTEFFSGMPIETGKRLAVIGDCQQIKYKNIENALDEAIALREYAKQFEDKGIRIRIGISEGNLIKKNNNYNGQIFDNVAEREAEAPVKEILVSKLIYEATKKKFEYEETKSGYILKNRKLEQMEDKEFEDILPELSIWGKYLELCNIDVLFPNRKEIKQNLKWTLKKGMIKHRENGSYLVLESRIEEPHKHKRIAEYLIRNKRYGYELIYQVIHSGEIAGTGDALIKSFNNLDEEEKREIWEIGLDRFFDNPENRKRSLDAMLEINK